MALLSGLSPTTHLYSYSTYLLKNALHLCYIVSHILDNYGEIKRREFRWDTMKKHSLE